MGYQVNDIVFSFTQGRDCDINDIQPVKQVKPERSFLNGFCKVGIGRRDNPDICFIG